MNTINEYKSFIKSVGGKSTHAKKTDYELYVNQLYWYKEFPWRTEQQAVFDAFIHTTYKHIIIQGIFGVGKSQMLLGLLFQAVLEKGIHYDNILYTAFNVCVKNEIKKKMKDYGIRKIQISTFDSIVYKLCKYNNMKGVDEPNYDGRRRFLYNNSSFNTSFEKMQLVILDECQDLEIQALKLFQRAFPNATFIFAGDILQSIQKEPKESILWQVMMNDVVYSPNSFKKIFMYETPRVPIGILDSLRTALSSFYPELSNEFEKWTSKNTVTPGSISWHQFSTYKEIFQNIFDFCTKYDPNDVMILSFSSSITVRGTLGDVSRIRNFLKHKNIPVNNNHKQMDKNCVFVSTANSSKGLERKHIFIVLTFPLEKAFINFSNNLVMNLITVAISRAQESVTIYIPNVIEKMSPILKHYESVPEPTIHYIPPVEKGRKELIKSDNFIFEEMIEIQHSVIEAINLNVFKYETLEYIQSFAKPIFTSKLCKNFTRGSCVPKLFRDEERILTGLIVENLITTEISKKWPFNPINMDNLTFNPGYQHCIKKIRLLFNTYNGLKNCDYEQCSIKYVFHILHIYSQLLLATSHKIFVSLSTDNLTKLETFWTLSLKYAVNQLKPTGEYEIKVQNNCKMPYLTGIIDVFVQNTEPFKTTTFWEIKASSIYDWENNALSQVMLYILMHVKSICTVVLVNPFQNTFIKYAIRIPNINTVRNKVINDILVYNANSYLAKSINEERKDCIGISDSVFVVSKMVGNECLHAVVCKLFSPTRIEILYNQVGITDKYKVDEEGSSETHKMAKETMMYLDTVENECHNIYSKYPDVHHIISPLEENVMTSIIRYIIDLSRKYKFVYYLEGCSN